MILNIHEKTGIAFGILHGNSVPELLDEICMNGTDETFEAYRQELADGIVGCLKDAEPNEDAMREELAAFLDDISFCAEKLVSNIDCEELVQTRAGESIDGMEIIDALGDCGLWDNYESDENQHSYTLDSQLGPVKLLVSYLGGAPNIWVCESPYVATCRKCSPCIPNGGDLDSPSEHGEMAYCLPPDEMPNDWQGAVEPLGPAVLKLHKETTIA